MALSVKSIQDQTGVVVESIKTKRKSRTLLLAWGGLFVGLFLALGITSQIYRANTNVHTIAYDSIPSIDAASLLETRLQQLNATAADYVSADADQTMQSCRLPDGRDGGITTHHTCDEESIPKYQELVNNQLYQVTRNVTYVGESTAIHRIQDGLSQYNGAITQLLSDFRNSKMTSRSMHDWYINQSYADFNKADAILKEKVGLTSVTVTESDTPACSLSSTTIDPKTNLPVITSIPANVWENGSLQTQVRCLAAINSAHLSGAYTDSTATQNEILLWVGIASLICVALLIVRLIRVLNLIKKPRRRLEPWIYGFTVAGLLLATIGFATAYMTLSSLSGDHGSIHEMVISSRISIDATNRINDYGTDANANESEYLISNNFVDQSAVDKWQQAFQTNKKHVDNDIDVAFKNKTYHPAEDVAIADMQKYWNEYNAMDIQIRQSVSTRHGDVSEAQKLSLGPSNTAFGNFMAANTRLMQINQQHYDSTLQSVIGQLTFAAWMVPICLLLAGICTLISNQLLARQQ